METKGINMEQLIAASDAAKALGVPVRTINFWLKSGELKGEQSLTGRWSIPVSELYRVIRERGFEDKPVGRQLGDRLLKEILPKYEKKGGNPPHGADIVSTDVLCLS